MKNENEYKNKYSSDIYNKATVHIKLIKCIHFETNNMKRRRLSNC